MQTSKSQKKYGSLIDDEASLMCESLRSIDEDDSFDTDLNVSKITLTIYEVNCVGFLCY